MLKDWGTLGPETCGLRVWLEKLAESVSEKRLGENSYFLSAHCASDKYPLNTYNDPVRWCDDQYCQLTQDLDAPSRNVAGNTCGDRLGNLR